MFIHFYTIFNSIIILGKFSINNKKYTFVTKGSKTKQEALEKFFTGYQDACKELHLKIIPIKQEEDNKRFTFRIEKPNHSKSLKVFSLAFT
jgi:hypothetical protein